MKATELKSEEVREGAYLVEGEDGYLVRLAAKRFRESVPEEEREFALKEVDSLKTFDALEDALSAPSFFGGRCVVLVRDETYKEREGDTERLRRLLKDCFNTVVFVRVALPRAIKAMCTRVDCAPLTQPEAVAELERRYPFLKGRYAALIAENTGRDMDRMLSEGEKLRAYALGERVPEEAFTALMSAQTENEVYEFSNALALGNRAKGMEIYERFRARGISPVFLLASLTNQYRRMFYAAASELSAEALAGLFGVKEYAVTKARETAKRYGKKKLKFFLDELERAEYDFKSGKLSDLGALERAIGILIQG